MIERQIVAQKMKRKQIEEYVFSYLGKLSFSKLDIQRTPLGDRDLIYSSKPGLVVGKKGESIRGLTIALKEIFNMDNPQIEVVDVENPDLDAVSMVKNMIGTFERFGPKRFKAIAYKALERIMKAGAVGAELVISGRGVPGERAKTWRFTAGYLCKSGNIAENYVDKADDSCYLRSGAVGIKVSILHPETKLPDTINFKKIKVEEIIVEEKKDDNAKEIKKEVGKENIVEEKSKPVKKVKRNVKKEINDGDNKK